MTKFGATTTLTIFAVFLLLVITWRPEYLSDSNGFLKEFVDQDLLGFMGVVLTLSIGLLAQLFLSVAKLEEKLGREAVSEIRNELRSSAVTLVYLFSASVIMVFIKPILPDQEKYIAGINAVVCWLTGFYLLILFDVVLSIFDFDI